MFGKFFAKKPAALTGAPVIRRLKTYSAQTGYVYQYYYEGHRPSASARGTEFVFHISADAKKWHDTSVLLSDGAIGAWEAAHHRTLAANERYAIAKMALFQAFDERAQPSQVKDDVHVQPADVEAILETLGLA